MTFSHQPKLHFDMELIEEKGLGCIRNAHKKRRLEKEFAFKIYHVLLKKTILMPKRDFIPNFLVVTFKNQFLTSACQQEHLPCMVKEITIR